MPRCLPKVNVVRRLQTTTRLTHRRRLHISSPPSLVIPSLQCFLDKSLDSPVDALRARKVTELLDSLTRVGNASRVWAYYLGLLSVLRNEKLPVQLHQEVLRKCTPSTAEVRLAASRRLILGNRPKNPHLHEGRFRTIIRNIRAMGETPLLDDYHFILEQFAAVGHYQGAMHIYNELQAVGLRPRSKTIGLCLQALAHRLTLPVSKDRRTILVMRIRQIHKELLDDMSRLNVGFASVNFDLSVRLLKDSLDKESCEKLVKMGYGIDLSNPDRPVLEYLHDATAVGDPLFTKLPAPQRFTTAALNTIIDLLGRLGDVSRLVQAFEVLTQPLPARATQHFSSTFDDEEDDYSTSISPPTPQHIPLPSAAPNTTTYNTLIRHLSKAGHLILARHYILQAMVYDRTTDRKVRGQIAYGIPLERVHAPHFAINRGTLLPAFGEANRSKNISFMRWIQSKIPSILRRKRNDVKFYTERLGELAASSEPASQTSSAGDLVLNGTHPMDASQRPSPSAFFVPSASKSSVPTSVFDLDLDAPPVVAPPPTKLFNINLHLQVLQRDINEIEELAATIADTLGRTTQRVKERLGRRVWSSKDIYLRSADRRVRVSRKKWTEQVNYQPQWKKRSPTTANIGPPLLQTPRFSKHDWPRPRNISSISTAAERLSGSGDQVSSQSNHHPSPPSGWWRWLRSPW